MKNLKFLSCLILLTFLAICPEANSAPFYLNNSIENIGKTTLKSDQSNPGRKKKDGTYKRKKGFMWGLFKKKSACDCPKH